MRTGGSAGGKTTGTTGASGAGATVVSGWTEGGMGTICGGGTSVAGMAEAVGLEGADKANVDGVIVGEDAVILG